MERDKFEDRLYGAFVLICIALIIIISKNNIDPSDKLFYISIGLFLVPLTLITIYVVSRVKYSIISDYAKFRKDQEKEIVRLQQLIKTEKSNEKRVEYSEKITLILNQIGKFRNNRFKKQVIISFLTIVAAAFFSFIDIGHFIPIQNWTIVIILIFVGIYYSTKTITDLFFSI